MPVAAFLAAATAITQALGEPATYLNSDGETVALRAVLQKDLITPIVGMEGMTQDRRTVITLRAADLATPPIKGDAITIGATTYTVLALEADDGYTYTLKVRADRA